MSLHKRCAIEAAVKAGKFIKSNLTKPKIVSYKGEINLVTNVDRKAEDIIIRKLEKSFPSYSFLAEERGAGSANYDYRWIIDPLDGTTNYMHGFPFFCTSIVLEKGNDIILGVVYDPIREELFCAEKGRGAFLNKRKIRVSKTLKLKNSLLGTGFAYDFKNADRSNMENFINFIMHARAVRRAGSAALDLCYVACGRFDGFWELDLYPWDTSAASLIVKEGGGIVSKFSGKPYSQYDKEILASNGKIHSDMIKVLNEAKQIKISFKEIKK